jgi:hypothetical protein
MIARPLCRVALQSGPILEIYCPVQGFLIWLSGLSLIFEGEYDANPVMVIVGYE